MKTQQAVTAGRSSICMQQQATGTEAAAQGFGVGSVARSLKMAELIMVPPVPYSLTSVLMPWTLNSLNPVALLSRCCWSTGCTG
jgi:hypothetical protein